MKSRKTLLFLTVAGLVALLAVLGCNGGSSSAGPTPPETPAVSKFVGTWWLPMVEDPRLGFDATFAENGAFALFKHLEKNPAITGTWVEVDGQFRGEGKQTNGSMTVTCLATLIDDNNLTFTFIEHKTTGDKVVAHTGTRVP